MAWAIGVCRAIYIYWLFVYNKSSSNSSSNNGFKKPIKLFTCSFFTPHKNQALPAVILGRSLDLSLDKDLNVILQGANLSNSVTAVSEMTISHNTKVLFLEVDNNIDAMYHRHHILSFYTLCKSPADYQKTTWDAALNVFVPGNRQWQQPIHVTMAPNILLKTKLKMEKLLQFIFIQQQQEQEQEQQQQQQQQHN